MPRIKRWHPVSHDYNRDPQIIDVRKRLGDWLALAWLEVLSIGDRNDGIVPGTIDQIAGILAPISLQSYLKYALNRARTLLEFALNSGWIRVYSDHIEIVNYGKYHRIEERKPFPPDPTEPDRTLIKENKEKKVGPQPGMSVQEFVESWNESFSGRLPVVQWPLSTSRQRKASLRLKEHRNLDFWQQVFNNIGSSDFLMGKNNGTWRCTFDFLIGNDNNVVKIYEGAYNGQNRSN